MGSHSSPQRSGAGGRGVRTEIRTVRSVYTEQVPSLACSTGSGVSGCPRPTCSPLPRIRRAAPTPPHSEGVYLACSHSILFMDARFEFQLIFMCHKIFAFFGSFFTGLKV